MQPRRRFRFIREIAEGGFGKVYLAEMQSGDNFSSVVAIKVLHGKWAQHEEIAQRSRDEARLLGRLRHRNIVRVEDLTSIHGQCAVIMEYLDGVDLKTLVNTISGRGERLPLRCCFEIVGAVAEALRAAYTHVPLQGGEPLKLIHRDIKPSNILLTVGGDVKLLDFGTARANFEEREARTQALAFGSQAYMAPERMMGDPDGPACDIFSLGVTGYEIISGGGFGKIPIRPDRFHGAIDERMSQLPLGQLSPELQQRTRDLLRAMLAYEPEDRPAAAQVVDVMEILADEARDQGLRRFARANVDAVAKANPHTPQGPSLAGETLFEDRSLVVEQGSLGDEDATRFAAERALEAVPDVPLTLQEGATMVPDDEPDDDEESSPVELSPLKGLPPHLQAVQGLETQVMGVDHEAPTVLEDEDELRGRLGYVDESKLIGEEVDFAEAATMVAGPVHAFEDEDSEEAPAPEPPWKAEPREAEPPRREARPPVDPEPTPAPRANRSKMMMVGALLGMFLLTVTLGGVGVAAWWMLRNPEAEATVPDEEVVVDEPPQVDEEPLVDQEPAEAFEVVGPAGGVRLIVSPDAQREVTLTKSGAGKLTVGGKGPIEVPKLHEGTWRTKTSGPEGSHRGAFEVVVGKTCSYTLDMGQGNPEWTLAGCE